MRLPAALARFAPFVLALAAACDGCAGCSSVAPPDVYDIERLSNPYDQRPAQPPADVVEAAARVIDLVSSDLGYGQGPGNVLRLRRNENWVARVTTLLARGGRTSLEAVHIDLVDSFTEAYRVNQDVKLGLRQSESRLQEAFADGVDDDVRNRTLLAEIAWCLHLIATITPDAGG